jgi:hypothetical protein
MGPPNGGNPPASQSGGVTPGDAQQAVQQQSQDPAPPETVQPCPTAKTWVEFCLVDMEGNPVSGQRYQATLPDGSTPQGTLGKSGCVRFNNIQPGTASISFLDLDGESWERI